MRRLLLGLLAFMASPALAAPQTVMPVPLTGTGAGLKRATFPSASSGVVCTKACSFYGVTVTLTSGQGPGKIMFWDSATVPADGAVTPFVCSQVDAGPRTVTVGSNTPWSVVNGLAWAFSSNDSCQTKAATVANNVAVSFKDF